MHLTARLGLVLFTLFAFTASLASAATGIIRNAPVAVEGMPLPAIYDLGAPPAVDLDNHFTFTPATSTDFAKITTPFGDIYIEFLAADAPKTVENFKSYLATDATPANDLIKTYDDIFVSRLVKKFVLQTGGYKIETTPTGPSLLHVTAKAPVVNEFKVANTRGTLAMAKVAGNPNSATKEWFFNLADNRANLDNQNGGFTVFARVLGDGMTIVDRIAALPAYNITPGLETVPLRYNGGNLNKSHFINLTKLRAVSGTSVGASNKTLKLAYSIIANTTPEVATATVGADGVLKVRQGAKTGHTYMTLRVQAVGGHYLDVPFTVVRAGAPAVLKQLPATTTAALGTTFTLSAKTRAWPLNIQWELGPTKNGPWTAIAPDDARFSGATTETLTVNLRGETPAAINQAFALNNQHIRFRLFNDHGEAAGNPTALRITTTLGFTTTPAFSVSNPLGSSANGKLGATLTAPLGGTVVLSRPALPATYPAVTYRWERLAPGSSTWEALVNSVAAVKGNGTDQNPQFPAVPSPYSGVTTSTLKILLNGPETPPANSTAISTLATLALHQSQYRCVITHDRGTGDLPAYSPVTTLRITAVPLKIATQPPKLVYGLLTHVPGLTEDQISVTRISVAAKPTASNTPAKYRWEGRLAGTTAWEPLVEHVPPTPADDDTPASDGAPTPYKGVDTATLTIRFPTEKNLEFGYGLYLDGAQYRCVMTNVLKDAPAPFAATAGPVVTTFATLRVLAGTVSLVTQEEFNFPGLPGAGPGVRFSVQPPPQGTGLPKGLSMDPETGLVTGVPNDKPGVFKVVVTFTVGPDTFTRTYYTELRPLFGFSSGSYEALLSPADQPPIAKLGLTVTSSGTLTGTLATTEEKALLSLKGAVVRARDTGVVTFKNDIVIARPAVAASPGIPAQPAGRAYVLTGLAIDPDSGKVEVKLHTRENAGAPLVEIASADSILTDDDDPETDTQIEVGNPGLRLSSYTKANPAPWGNINRYTLAFTDPVPLAPTEAVIPAGSGYATAAMAPDGKLSLSGKLGDGTQITATIYSDVAGDYRLFLRPYNLNGAYFSAFINTTGLLSSPVGVNSYSASNSFLRHTVAYSLGNEDAEDDFDDGTLVFWRRPAPPVPPAANAKPVAYSDGFPPLGLRVRMEPWYYLYYDQLGFTIAPDGNSATMDLTLSGAGMDNTETNPRGLPTALRFTIDRKGKRLLHAATLPDSSNFSAVIDNGTGKFTGQLTLADTAGDPPADVSRKVSVEGVLLVPPEPFRVELLYGIFPQGFLTPNGKIIAEGLGLVPALPGGAPLTSRVTLDKFNEDDEPDDNETEEE